MYRIKPTETPLPAGSYYIGDPCYVIKDDEWMTALEETLYFNLFPSPKEMKTNRRYNSKDMQHGVFESRGHLFAVSTTEFGDGVYPCRDDGIQIGRCGVDAGLIAAIPISFIKKHGNESDIDLGTEYTFNAPFNVSYSGGVIGFGSIEVITCDEYECPGCGEVYLEQSEADYCCEEFECEVCGSVYYDEWQAEECCEEDD